MPFFASAGYDCYAVSLRGQGRSERAAGMQAGSLTQHVADLSHVVSSLSLPPVMIGHSFGGLVVQRCAAQACNTFPYFLLYSSSFKWAWVRQQKANNGAVP